LARRKNRYASFDAGKGKAFEDGNLTLEDLRAHAFEVGEPTQISGKQEYFENLINKFI
jgi:xylose isomerase